MTGFFPIMMFGLPASALVMYHTAKTSKKKAGVAGVIRPDKSTVQVIVGNM